jgi:carbon-monoxide dehydrogenase catalytic subunit
MVARNLLHSIAAGAAAHSDHARDVAHNFLLVSQGEAPSYQVKDKAKVDRNVESCDPEVPACVRACPTGALIYATQREFS